LVFSILAIDQLERIVGAESELAVVEVGIERVRPLAVSVPVIALCLSISLRTKYYSFAEL